jgi:hypothetical protein
LWVVVNEKRQKLVFYARILWLICLITLGVVAHATQEDIERQRNESKNTDVRGKNE